MCRTGDSLIVLAQSLHIDSKVEESLAHWGFTNARSERRSR